MDYFIITATMNPEQRLLLLGQGKRIKNSGATEIGKRRQELP
jgi:hypothetical protein